MTRRSLPVSVTAALAAAVLVLALSRLPQSRIPLDPAAVGFHTTRTAVSGAFHVHTRRSDGTGTPDEVAAAAKRAELQFIIFTDHGDGTRAPDIATYRDGVLCIDGVEISTNGGHYIALDMPASPYPLGGEPRDVVEDVRRLGGFGIAAHPDSAKPELRWRDWDTAMDGLEWLNADSEWRNERATRLMLALLEYPFRRPETLVSLFDRPQQTLVRWDDTTKERQVVALAGTDAHARVTLGGATDPYSEPVLLSWPPYEAAFRSFALRVELEHPLTGVAAADGRDLLRALKNGHVYTAIDALAGPAMLDFSARSGEAVARMGERLAWDGTLDVAVRTVAPGGAQTVLLRNGDVIQTADAPSLDYRGALPGAYRVEVRIPDAPGMPPIPWILSNPIYVGIAAGGRAATAAAADTQSHLIFDEGDASGWNVEHDAGSLGAVEATSSAAGRELAFTFALERATPHGQYAALVNPAVRELPNYNRLSFIARSDRPMRISLQVRLPGGEDGERWGRSVFVDRDPRPVTVSFDDLAPTASGQTLHPDLTRTQTLLFVVDTTNTRPGTSGAVWFDDIRLVR